MSHSLITRRVWIKASVAGMASSSLSVAAERPSLHFPTDARERLSVATYPFRKVIGKLTLGNFAKTVPAQFGVKGLEPWSPHIESTDGGYLRSLRAQLDEAQMHVVNIAVDAETHLCGSEADRAAGLAVYRKWIEAALILGSPSIRVHLPGDKKSGTLDCAIRALGDLAKYAASKNVVVNLENDDPGNEAPERIVQVITSVNSPYLRALPDFCNSMLIHNDESYNDQALAKLFPLAYNISHAKDEEHDGKAAYRVSMGNIFALARKAGYRGYFSMEWEGLGDPYDGTRKLIEQSLRHLNSK